MNEFRGYETFFILNSTLHEIDPTHKCENVNIGISTLTSMINNWLDI